MQAATTIKIHPHMIKPAVSRLRLNLVFFSLFVFSFFFPPFSELIFFLIFMKRILIFH